jgi:hypothetical protein
MIQFTANYGDEKKIVSISKPLMNSDTFTINIDGWYNGDVYYRYNKWWIRPSTEDSGLTADDAQVLGWIIELSGKWKPAQKLYYRYYDVNNETVAIFDIPAPVADLETRLNNQLILYERDAKRKLQYEEIDNPQDYV